MNNQEFVDILSARLMLPALENGDLINVCNPDDLREQLCVPEQLMTPEELETLFSIYMQKREREELDQAPFIPQMFKRFNRFPVYEKVWLLMGTQVCERYRAAIETIENSARISAYFPEPLSVYPWRKLNVQNAVELVTTVIAPCISNFDNMKTRYTAFCARIRARKRESMQINRTDDIDKRKKMVRSYNIWLPVNDELDKWPKVPEVAAIFPEFIDVMQQAKRQMIMVPNFLQYVPRKRIGKATIKDIPHNLERMKRYIKGDSFS